MHEALNVLLQNKGNIFARPLLPGYLFCGFGSANSSKLDALYTVKWDDINKNIQYISFFVLFRDLLDVEWEVIAIDELKDLGV